MIDRAALDDALQQLGDPAGRDALLRAIARYRAEAELAAGAPRLAELRDELQELGDQTRRLAGRLRRLSPFAALVLDAEAEPLPANGEGAGPAAEAGHLPELAARLAALAALAVAQLSALDTAVDIGRGGARRADVLLTGSAPRWTLLRAAARLWRAAGHRLSADPAGAFTAFAADVALAAGAPVHGLEELVRQLARQADAEPAVDRAGSPPDRTGPISPGFAPGRAALASR
jgi:hypothetical protein